MRIEKKRSDHGNKNLDESYLFNGMVPEPGRLARGQRHPLQDLGSQGSRHRSGRREAGGKNEKGVEELKKTGRKEIRDGM